MSRELPIDTNEPMATQSRQALMIADEMDLLTYRQPFDLRVDTQRTALRAELGEAAELPDDAGVYYLVYVTDVDDNRHAVLLPEGEVRAFVLALAVKWDLDAARRVQYVPGTLPA